MDILRDIFPGLSALVPEVLEACGHDSTKAFEKLQDMQVSALPPKTGALLVGAPSDCSCCNTTCLLLVQYAADDAAHDWDSTSQGSAPEPVSPPCSLPCHMSSFVRQTRLCSP